MTPALIEHSGDILPWDKFKTISSAIIWNRDGHFRLVPEGRVRDFHRLMRLKVAGPDSKPLRGIRWEDTEVLS